MSDPLSFLDEEPEADTTGAAAKPAGEGETSQTGAEGGKPAEEQAEGAAANAQEAPEGGEAGTKPAGEEGKITAEQSTATVPIGTLLDEREKRQKAEQERDALKAAREEVPEITPPDPKEDPEGYAEYTRNELAVTVINERLNVSERFAKKEHGAEKVAKVKAWAEEKFGTDIAFAQKVLLDPDPYEVAIAEYDKEQLGEFAGLAPDEIEAIKALRAKKNPGSTGADQGGSTTINPQAANGAKAPGASSETDDEPLPKTIADESSAGGGAQAVATGPGQAFAATFAD